MRARKRAFSKYLVVMLTLLWSAALVSGAVWASVAPGPQTEVSGSISKAQVMEDYGRLPLFFIENQGQTDPQVKFYSRAPGHTIFYTSEGMVLSLTRGADQVDRGGKGTKGGKKDKPAVVQLRPQGMRPDVEILASDPLPAKVNYFQGNDPAKWQQDVATYKSVLYREAYPGIDLKFYGVGQQVEYDLIVKPGADPKQVKFSYQGIKGLKVTKQGDLAITLPDGGKLVQQRPVIYQEINGQRISREGKFRVTGTRSYGFQLASYDARYPLIIDPVTLVYSTYLGGSTWESANSIAVDAAGNAYVTGTTQSLDFPVTAGAFQPAFGGLPEDAFVVKFSSVNNPAGLPTPSVPAPIKPSLLFATYLGGNNDDIGMGIALDPAGNAYVTGETFSSNFPVSIGAFQAALTGTNAAFVTKFNPTGAMVYSTYLGGSRDASNVPGTGSDMGKVIAVDAAGSAYVSGDTSSIDFPRSATPFQNTLNGTVNSFVTKFTPAGGLAYSTYLGGSVSEANWGIAVDAAGTTVYVVGETQSANFPVTNASTIKGLTDAYVTKLNPAAAGAAGLVFSTYWGGDGDDPATGGVAVDPAGNFYVSGNTNSLNFPTVAPFQATLKGFNNAFVTKFDATTNAAVYSTYLGGNNTDIAWFTAVDKFGSVYVTGETGSTDFPLNIPFQAALPGGSCAFVTKFNPAGSGLIYSTFLGGNTSDFGFGIALDSFTLPYVAGFTLSTNFPLNNAIKTTPATLGSAFVAKLTLFAVSPFLEELLLDD